MEIQTKQLVLAVKQIAEEKNLPNEVVHEIVEQAMAAAYRKDHGKKDQEVRTQINTNTGEMRVFVSKEIVDKVEDGDLQISIEDAKQITDNAKIGEMVEIERKAESFGRVAAQTAKQVILQKLREAEREIVLTEYNDKIGEVLSGVVQRVESRIIRIDLGKASGILPQSEQIPGEHYSIGSRIKVFLKDVERSARGPQLILSRANTSFIEHLFRNEVPEMENGAVEIKAIAREAGVRTKIAVASSVPGVDPVGTFVGGHGTRVQAVMSEIGDQEKIDIISYEEDPAVFIKSALSPTEVADVKINDKEKKATVKVAEDQLSVAIGKGGQNVRLASSLTGYEIDIESLNGRAKESPAKSADKTNDNEPRRKKRQNIEDSLLSAINEQQNNSEEE
ncbi:transcription termination/antitermination protein NusA [Candidatus Saccharibacteria bacterium CPR2]|nr:transcription termination/antitermination protein NusA [Candidatus Saccharibacteria bacterium CPR2]